MSDSNKKGGVIDTGLHGRMRGAPPPKTKGLELEVVRIISVEPRLYVILSEKPWGAYFHWGGGSIPCDGDPEICERCKKLVPLKWRGYLHALEQNGESTREVIVELTHVAIATLDLGLAMRDYRGSMVRMRKTKGGAKGRFLIDVLERRVTNESLPPEKDPAPVLKKLWELNVKRYSDPK